MTARFPEQGSVTMPLDDEVGALIDALQAARDATTKPLNGS